MPDRAKDIILVAGLFFALSWITVSLRIYVRGFMMKKWGKDDSFMVATLAVFTVYLAFQLVSATYGAGKHRWELSYHDAKTALLFWWLSRLLYILCCDLLKISIALFYLRVAQKRIHIIICRVLMVGNVVVSLVYFFLILFQCRPIPSVWNDSPVGPKCLKHSVHMGITYLVGVGGAGSDWVFGILPFFIVWSMDMKFKQKLLVAGILAFAAIGSIGTIVRIFYLHTLFYEYDFLYTTVDITIWSIVEPGIGITAASIATLRPLLRILLWRMGSAKPPRDRRDHSYYHFDEERKRKAKRGFKRSLSPSDLVKSDFTGTTAQTKNSFATKSVSSCHSPPPKSADIDLIEFSPTTVSPSSPKHYEDMILPTETAPAFLGASLEPVREERPKSEIRADQDPDAPPRLHLRDSVRNSFGLGGIPYIGNRLPD